MGDFIEAPLIASHKNDVI